MKLQLKKLFRYRDLIDEYGNRILNYQHALGCIRIAVRDDCVSEIIQKKYGLLAMKGGKPLRLEKYSTIVKCIWSLGQVWV